MKKALIIFALAAISVAASAQTYYRVVYIPGPGEHQFGFNLAPSFAMGAQHLGVSVTDLGSTSANDADGLLTNMLGVGAGIFYGYETVGNTLNWGNYTALYYGINPFSGEVTFANGTKHKVDYFAHQVQLQFNPFLSYSINDQLSVSGGLGLNICPWLPSKVKLDGQTLEVSEDADVSILKSILNSYLDVNAGVKYWFSDELYVGLRLQYDFFNVMNLLENAGELDEDSSDILDVANGAVSIDMNKGTASTMILPKNTIHAIFSVGFVW